MLDKFNLQDIKLGDKVIIRGSSSFGTIIGEVTKVNKTTFVANNYTFKKENGSQYGGDTWSRKYASLATEEEVVKITAENRRQRLATALGRFNFFSLPIEKLQAIAEIIKKDEQL